VREVARIKRTDGVLFRLHGKCVLALTACAAALLFIAPGVLARQTAPEGIYLQAGLAGVGGYGASVGLVGARRMHTREAHLVSELDPLLRKSTEQVRMALLLGSSLRVFGVERTVGNVGYRGYDVDVGIRAGPALSFSSRDNTVARNSRFSLLLEPAVRISHVRPGGRIWFLDVGTIKPAVRIGVWIDTR